ncbi:hypothetical protein M758_6G129900 [Ceratodon purpureus]|nr:hypothetical protein M758_6G129900 [Ceratodon purpureus]
MADLSPDMFGDSMTGQLANQLIQLWLSVRAPVVAPLLQFAINVCLVMVTMLFVERIFMCGVMVFVKLLRRTPESVYKFEPIRDDLEFGNSAYPMVLVQIPMYNEREVYQLSIQAACGLSWPADRIIIQVLDDSTDQTTRELVQMEVQRWASKGINIKYETRSNRKGYKAGALKQGMKHPYVGTCEHVAIFDADFQPEADFLMRTVPFLVKNQKLALVQARWKFVNGDECLMTKMQEVSLNYHFSVEQRVGSATYGFFGFNGTAGVWRIRAMEEAGGWNDRTTVEDMDLAVRASLCGWKFVYIHDLEVKNELPSTFNAFRFQQHRWSCGPANLFRKVLPSIINNKVNPLWKRLHMIYAFFFVRKIVAHIVTFTFYCVVIPASVLVPEVDLPFWGAVYVPSTITLLNAITTPKSLHLLVFWILFENVMSLHRTKATIIGLFDIGNVNEWIVTEKLGNLMKYRSAKYGKKYTLQRMASNMLARGWKMSERMHLLELWTGGFLMFCAFYDFYFQGKNHFFVYLGLQSCAFIVMGLGYVGTFVPSYS